MPTLLRCLLFLVVIGLLTACSKPVPLADTVVAAATPADFTRFRAELGARFPAEQLADFDTATQELQLDAMARFDTAAEREADMLRAANGKAVQAVTVLGWQARRARFLREIAELEKMLERDLKLTPTDAVLRRIGSEREVLAKLRNNLTATEQRLAALNGH